MSERDCPDEMAVLWAEHKERIKRNRLGAHPDCSDPAHPGCSNCAPEPNFLCGNRADCRTAPELCDSCLNAAGN